MKIKLWPDKNWQRAIILLFVLLFLPYIFSRVLSPWRQLTVHSLNESTNNSHIIKTRIRVACYNIAHGRGTVHSNWEGGSKVERQKRLAGILKLIKNTNADILILNEVDFDASWSYSVNQAAYLAEKAGFPYRIEQRNLDFRFLIWTWRFGNAVLSKFPISDPRVIDLPSYSGLETILAGKKRGIQCNIKIGTRKVQILGVHLSHRSESIRTKSAELLVKLTKESDAPSLVVGDLNSTPRGFPESITTDNGKNAIDSLDDSNLFIRYDSESTVPKNHFTYSSTNPTMVIDWIFIPNGWEFKNYSVVPSTLSDHRLIYADIELNSLNRK